MFTRKQTTTFLGMASDSLPSPSVQSARFEKARTYFQVVKEMASPEVRAILARHPDLDQRAVEVQEACVSASTRAKDFRDLITKIVKEVDPVFGKTLDEEDSKDMCMSDRVERG